MLITDSPLYIQGDFNSGRTAANSAIVPLSNTAAGPRMSVYDTAGTPSAKQVLTLACDAVTVLYDPRQPSRSLIYPFADYEAVDTPAEPGSG